jgi:hypothetical protein
MIHLFGVLFHKHLATRYFVAYLQPEMVPKKWNHPDQ